MATPDDAFDPHAFPADLVAAQLQVTELFAALHTRQETLPWAREGHPGFPADDERGRQHPGRPETPGWEADAAAEYDRLWEELREATAVVHGHPHWEACQANGVTGPDLVAARQALKRAEGAVPAAPGGGGPLGRGDVRTAA